MFPFVSKTRLKNLVEADDDVMATAAVLPVLLYDGDRQVDAGNVKARPDLVLEEFQMMLSQMMVFAAVVLTIVQSVGDLGSQVTSEFLEAVASILG